ncbi:uncharacterized protein FA14DRAFT_174138 [Meira miltonrushii]|uniref:GDP/GTP exchange factor Sec2 N-terminal domain-containing protein n=1 Tax=Meira miltonrushii TaxID=1280837 RepID=A0A316VAK3_9BASI|nr:uncharacterized protein FA14DRAFT_174138 [Meira miltonrushii]PWN34480.1 hypothetical protein FA14DRAFT_174138 [Meira miltonrushii]
MMSTSRQNPYILDTVDLGDTDGFGVGLGLNVDQDSKRSRPGSSSSFRSSEQRNVEAVQQTLEPLTTARNEIKSIEDQASSSGSNPSSANRLLALPPPPRPKRRSRHERTVSHSTDGEKDGEGDLDVQIEAALNYISRHGMSTNMAQRDSVNSNKTRSQKRIHRNAGLMGTSTQETDRLRSDFHKALSRIAEQAEHGMENGKEHAASGKGSSTNGMSRARQRSGSILRAFSKGRSNFSFDSAKTMLGTPSMGFSTPSRTTQMTFDALPENVVGPSNRLGMADFVAWSPQEASDKRLGSPDQRQRSVSNATSTSSNRNSRYETQESPIALKRQSSDQSQMSSMMAALKAAKEEAREAQTTKAKLMTEMEQMSEELFLQANEMVKQERIKSSALEKELESLKLAMSNVATGANDAADPIDLTNSIEAGAQNDNEAMMMAAVADASRECAEAEEEAEEWRKHCEELESRIVILEEALYNSMALLSQREGLDGLEDEEAEQQEADGLDKILDSSVQNESLHNVKERESIDETPSRNSLVIPQKAFSESTSSFYSAGDQSSVGLRSPETNTLSPTLTGPSNEEEASTVDTLYSKAENGIQKSLADEESERPNGTGDVPESNIGREDKASSQLEAESVQSTSSHQSSSSSAGRAAMLPRSSSVIGSRRQSRQTSLPPRLPEPVSPLPSIPNEQNWLPKIEQENADGNLEALSTHLLSARLSDATTTSRSSSNLKHENDFNQFSSNDDIQIVQDDWHKPLVKVNGSETFRSEGIKTEPIGQLPKFESCPQFGEIGKNRRSHSSLTPQVYSPSIDESDDFDRESHETSRARSYIAPSSRPSIKTTESAKKKSLKRNILKNMPPAAPTGRKGSNSIGDGSIASVSLYSGISSPSMESELKKRNSNHDENQQNSKIREHYAKMHQTSPGLQDDAKKKQSFARRKRFN